MCPLKIVGLGPGHPDYILPAATKAIAESKLILCGRRHTESFDTAGKEILLIGEGRSLAELMAEVKERYRQTPTALVVSGDCGFYSLLSYARKVIPREDIEAIPGISSLQFFFAKLGMPWQDAGLLSLHGRQQDVLGALKTHSTLGLLTDGENNAAAIASLLFKAGITDKWIYVGEDLSYPEERITRLTIEEARTFQEQGMAVVVIADE
jgi:cobalt-precorrin-7 (C5)-methyltransferase